MSLALIVTALIVLAFQTLAENVISPKSTSLPGLRKTSSLSVPEASANCSKIGLLISNKNQRTSNSVFSVSSYILEFRYIDIDI